MFSYRSYIITIFTLTLITLITSGMAGAEDNTYTASAGTDGMKYFLSGMYGEAIQEFEKVSGKKDYKLQEALVTSYLKVGRFNAARTLASAISDDEEYQSNNPNESMARAFIDSLDDCKDDLHCCFERLMVAGKFAINLYPGNITRRKVGIIEKRYAADFEKDSAGYKLLLKDAAEILGERLASGFEIEKVDIDTYKVTFMTRDNISVFEQERGNYLTIIDVSNPMKVLEYYPDIAKTMPVDIGVKTEITIDAPLEFKAEKGAYVIFRYEKN